LALCREAEFSVRDDTEKTNIYTTAELMAQGFAFAGKQLDEYISQQVLLKLKSYMGVNVHPEPWTYDAVANTTDVPAVDYNAKMMAELVLDAQMNKMPSAYLIDSGSLYVDFLNRSWDAPNLDGKGDAVRIQALKTYFDMWNFAPAGVTENTFMINRSAVVLASKNDVPDPLRYVGGDVNMWTYTMASPSLPGIKFDVFHRLTCAYDATKKREYFVHAFKVRVKFDLLKNPNGCPVTINSVVYNPTGIISYTKVA
jgi:hypothetical protein